MEKNRKSVTALGAIEWLLKALRIVLGAAIALFMALLLYALFNQAELELEGPHAIAAFVSSMALAAVAARAGMVAAARLGRVLATVRAGDPFVPENARNLRWIAASFAVFILAYLAAKLMTQFAAPQAGGVDWLAITPSIAAPLLLLVLASVFDAGTEMRDDLEGLV